MSLLAMAWRYLMFRRLVTFLTVACLSIGVALVCAVLALLHESESSVSRDCVL
mgnify:FL=1